LVSSSKFSGVKSFRGGTSTPLNVVDTGPESVFSTGSALLTRRLFARLRSFAISPEGMAKVGIERSERSDHASKEDLILAGGQGQRLEKQ
jgi:hypothetical protein